MDITYSTSGELKLNGKNLSMSINPSAASKADVVLLSSANSELPAGLTVFDGPGEYEVKGCMIDAVPIAPELTAFRIYLDGVQLGYLPEITSDTDPAKLSGSDVLFMPLKGLKAEAVAKIVGAIEPKVVIPTNYSDSELTAFLSEMGAKGVEPVEKYKFARKDLPEDKQDIVVLKG